VRVEVSRDPKLAATQASGEGSARRGEAAKSPGILSPLHGPISGMLAELGEIFPQGCKQVRPAGVVSVAINPHCLTRGELPLAPALPAHSTPIQGTIMNTATRLLTPLLVIALVASFIPANCFAAEVSPSDSQWEHRFNLKEGYASPIGQRLKEHVLRKAPEKLSAIDDFIKALGFNPLTNVGEVVLFGDGYDETAGNIVAHLGSSRGNLEGWMLAAPGYQSEQLSNDTLLHSFVIEKGRFARRTALGTVSVEREVDEPLRIWCALPQSKDGSYILVASFDRDKSLRMIDRAVDSGIEGFGDSLSGDRIYSLRVKDFSSIPIMFDEQKPGAAALKTIDSLTFHAASEAEKFTAECEITAIDSARARQLHQLLTGLKAMAQLAANSNGPDSQRAAEMARNVEINYNEGETQLTTRFSIGYDWVMDLLEKL